MSAPVAEVAAGILKALQHPIEQLMEWGIRFALFRRASRTLLVAMSPPHPRWRSLGALMREVAMNPADTAHQDRAEYFLARMGARVDRTTGSAARPRIDQLWGLKSRVGD